MNTLERMVMDVRHLQWQIRVPRLKWKGQPSRFYRKSAGTLHRMFANDVEVF